MFVEAAGRQLLYQDFKHYVDISQERVEKLQAIEHAQQRLQQIQAALKELQQWQK